MIAVVDFTNATIVAAAFAAFAAVIGGLVRGVLDYRLKKKEFRVIQIKSRIDTLEQAVSSSAPEPGSKVETKEDLDRLSEGITEIKAAAWRRLDSVENQYTKYKWLLDPQFHRPIADMLADCRKRSSMLALDSVRPDLEINQFKVDLFVFIDKTQGLQKDYEDARLSTIERLYHILNKEVGISLDRKSNAP
jgi:hypothetical protein